MRIAIVVPAFNVALFIGDAIASVLAQTHANWSLVAVDDGSTDATASVIRNFSDPRIALVQQPNAGVSAARNLGIAFCTAGTQFGPEALLFLDGDDWLAPDALKVLAETLGAAPWAVAACGRYARVAMNGVVRPGPSAPDGCMLERLLTRNLFANGGHLLIRREAIQAAGDFRGDLTYGEDWEYWARLAVLGEFTAVRSRAPLLFVRERQGSACLSHATDPEAYRRATDAMFRNREAASRLGSFRMASLRRQADAETSWSVGRELIRHGNRRAGQLWLGRSVRAAPNLKRLALIVVSWFRVGPFRPYPTAG